MMGEPCILFDPNRRVPQPSTGAPRAIGNAATAERYRLGEFLDAALMRPLWFDGERQQARVESALDAMTPAERVYIEIEMQSRAKTFHSFDYDPLR